MNLQNHKQTENSKRQQPGRSLKLELNSLVYGKVPPQAKDLEDAVLGAILLEKNCIEKVMDIITENSFYVEANSRIYKCCLQLYIKNWPIDTLTVVEELRKSEELEMVGGPYYITRLTNAVVSGANIEFHARIIQEKFIQREIIRVSSENIMTAYEENEDAFELLDKFETGVLAISQANITNDFHKIDSVMVGTITEMEKNALSERHITGVNTGFEKINRVTRGWQNTDLIIIAARPSVGKTAFALNLARNAALDPVAPVPVAFFSLEMSKNKLMQRMLSSESEVWLDRIKDGKMPDDMKTHLYQHGIQPLSKAPIFIDDSASLTMLQLRSKCRRLKAKHDIGLIIIDYLQLMEGDSKKNATREQEVAGISRQLKNLAKTLEVPIIALAQLSRAVEGRADRKPRLSDLRESGAIEQDADIVSFLYRPNKDEIEKDPELDGKGMYSIDKFRDGELLECILSWNPKIQRWKDLHEGPRHPFVSWAEAPQGFKPMVLKHIRNPDERIEKTTKEITHDEDFPF